LLEWFLAQKGGVVRGFRRALYTGISNIYCADLVGEIIERWPHLQGLYQVASEVITKYDLLCLAREAYDINVEIEPDDSVEVRRNLDGDKFRRSTGIVTPSWRTMMNDLAADPTPYAAWRHHSVV
jgi:dTDP-4-dehydrorhamnose reductase